MWYFHFHSVQTINFPWDILFDKCIGLKYVSFEYLVFQMSLLLIYSLIPLLSINVFWIISVLTEFLTTVSVGAHCILEKNVIFFLFCMENRFLNQLMLYCPKSSVSLLIFHLLVDYWQECCPANLLLLSVLLHVLC